MNLIHIIVEFSPFEELGGRPHVSGEPVRTLPGIEKEVNGMAFIFSLYTALLALAVWSENAGIGGIDTDDTGWSATAGVDQES